VFPTIIIDAKFHEIFLRYSRKHIFPSPWHGALLASLSDAGTIPFNALAASIGSVKKIVIALHMAH
jgi:hypothetical protein